LNLWSDPLLRLLRLIAGGCVFVVILAIICTPKERWRVFIDSSKKEWNEMIGPHRLFLETYLCILAGLIVLSQVAPVLGDFFDVPGLRRVGGFCAFYSILGGFGLLGSLVMMARGAEERQRRARMEKLLSPRGSMKNIIKVDRSVVGNISTGSVEKVYAALSDIRISGDTELEKNLAAFTEGVRASEELSEKARNEILEQLAVVAAEAAKPKDSRSWGVLKAVVVSISAAVANTGLAELWDKIKPMLGL
jgi:hypothetical protein